MSEPDNRLSGFLFEIERLLQYQLDTDPADYAHDRNEALQVYIDQIEQIVTHITGSEDDTLNPRMRRLLGYEGPTE